MTEFWKTNSPKKPKGTLTFLISSIMWCVLFQPPIIYNLTEQWDCMGSPPKAMPVPVQQHANSRIHPPVRSHHMNIHAWYYQAINDTMINNDQILYRLNCLNIIFCNQKAWKCFLENQILSVSSESEYMVVSSNKKCSGTILPQSKLRLKEQGRVS